MDTITLVTCLLVFFSCICCIFGQEDFFSPILCYECEDSAVNTTCSEAESPEESFNITECRRGGCIKWTYYVNHKLRIRRTCSENLNINIQLTDVCKTERYGNGILCMCPEDLCNGAGINRANGISYLASVVTALFVLANV